MWRCSLLLQRVSARSWDDRLFTIRQHVCPRVRLISTEHERLIVQALRRRHYSPNALVLVLIDGATKVRTRERRSLEFRRIRSRVHVVYGGRLFQDAIAFLSSLRTLFALCAC